MNTLEELREAVAQILVDPHSWDRLDKIMAAVEDYVDVQRDEAYVRGWNEGSCYWSDRSY